MFDLILLNWSDYVMSVFGLLEPPLHCTIASFLGRLGLGSMKLHTLLLLLIFCVGDCISALFGAD